MKNELIEEIKKLNEKLKITNTDKELEDLSIVQLQFVLANKNADLTYKLTKNEKLN